MSLKVNPSTERRNPEYGIAIEEIVAGLELGYTDTTAKTATIFEDTYEPDWRQNPDLIVRFTQAEHKKNYAASNWDRNGVVLQDDTTPVAIDANGLDHLRSYIGYKAPESIRSVKVTNPWPWDAYVTVQALESDFSTEVIDPLVAICGPRNTLAVDVVDFVDEAEIQGDLSYLNVNHYWYHEDYADNVLSQISTNDGFTLPTPDTDPRTMQPFYGAIAIDGYNILDKYGGLLAGGEALLAMSSQFMAERNAFEALGAVKGLARNYGVGVPSAATMLGLQSYMGWADETKILEQLVPSLAVALSPIASNWLIDQLPDKYMNTLNAATGMAAKGIAAGVATGATAYMMMRTMDDIAIHCEI